MPPSLRAALWPHHEDREGVARIRGLGWALAPSGSDAQALHADLWGHEPKLGRVRFPHLLWKREPGHKCTTEVVRGGFSGGRVRAGDYGNIVRASAPAILVDSEALHRGASTAACVATGSCGDASPSGGWVSTCSVELCSASGWTSWLAGTGGTEVANPLDEEWRMLTILAA